MNLTLRSPGPPTIPSYSLCQLPRPEIHPGPLGAAATRQDVRGVTKPHGLSLERPRGAFEHRRLLGTRLWGRWPGLTAAGGHGLSLLVVRSE